MFSFAVLGSMSPIAIPDLAQLGGSYVEQSEGTD
jgi:hypothetical protein